jgi:hypothetical protein
VAETLFAKLANSMEAPAPEATNPKPVNEIGLNDSRSSK